MKNSIRNIVGATLAALLALSTFTSPSLGACTCGMPIAPISFFESSSISGVNREVR